MSTHETNRPRRSWPLAAAFGATAMVLASVAPLALIQDPSTAAHIAHAAEKVAPTAANPVIDGAKTPELIPDDQAYHLVLMVASAADDAPAVEKSRATAVLASIVCNGSCAATDINNKDVSELAEVAKRHRNTLTTFAAEAAAGNTDADRLKSEHLSRVKADAELRLSPVLRKVLADYVNGQKAYMQIHGKPDPQAVAIPALLNKTITAAGYCDNEAGNLAPYCTDGCGSSRPCDKKCRRADESCSTCGQYGVCSGGGGGTPTPTPTPTPPPSGSQMTTTEPTGTIYSNHTFGDGGVLYVTGVTDTAASCSCHSSSATVRITTPGGTVKSSSSGVVGAFAQATVQYQSNVLDSWQEERIPVATEHTSFCPIRGITFLTAWPTWPDIRISVGITNYVLARTEGFICEYHKFCAEGEASCPANNPAYTDSRMWGTCKLYWWDTRLKSKVGDAPWRCWPIGKGRMQDTWIRCI